MSVKPQAAIEYILSHGDAWQQWSVRRLTEGTTGAVPPPCWQPRLNADGGACRPDAESPVSCMGATSGFLQSMVLDGFHDTVECKRAIAYVWNRQQSDGRWTEEPAPQSAPPPPWFEPGNLDVDLWETTNIVAALAALGFGDDPRLRKAVAWAEQHAQPDGGFPGYIHTTYGMAAAQWRLGSMDKAENHLRYARVFLETNPDIHDVNWGLSFFQIGDIPARHSTVRAYIDRLIETQGANGLWPTIYEGSEIYFALSALEVLRAYGMWQQ